MIVEQEGFFEKIWNTITGLVGTGAGVARRELSVKGGEKFGKTWGGKLAEGGAWGVAFIVDAYVTYREYKHEEEHIRSFFAPEIAAKLGKDPKKVTLKDMFAVAQTNSTIAEALRRNKKTRNLNFGINALSITISVFVTAGILGLMFTPAALAAPILSAVGMKVLLAGAAVAFGAFLGVEKPVEILGKKAFGLSEPELHAVVKKPGLQSKLSLPRQIEYLETLQHHKKPISQEQVMTAYIAADPGLAKLIQTNYGKPFAALSKGVRMVVLEEMGPSYNLDTVTGDLNTHRIRAQELAFTVQGQESGIPQPLTPRVPVQSFMEGSASSYAFRDRILDERRQQSSQTPVVS